MICEVKREIRKSDVVDALAALAFSRGGDAVRLLYMTPEEAAGARGLDLRLVADIKRSANGAVEVKLVDRIALLRLLAELVGGGGGAEELFRAVDGAAVALKERGDAD